MAGPTATSPKLWLAADVGTYSDAGVTPAVNGNTIQQWNDQSGNGNNASQATGGKRPLFTTNSVNGLPKLTFASASSQVMTHGCKNTTGTLVACGKVTTTGDHAWIGLDPSSGIRAPYYFKPSAAGSGNCGVAVVGNGGSEWDAIGGKSLGVPIIQYATINPSGTTVKLFQNGIATNSAVYSSQVAAGTNGYIGASYFNGVADFMNGDIYEILIYDVVLTQSELDQLTTYLRNRWMPPAPPKSLYCVATFDATLETLIIATSPDGTNFTQQLCSFCPAGISSNGATVRDPSVISISGIWYGATTAVSFGMGTKTGVMKSSDLAFWQPVTVIDWSSIANSNQVWAPELFLDSNGDVYCFATVALSTTSKHQLYWVKATAADLSTWTTPTAVAGGTFPTDCIDPYLILSGGTYYLWFKDENTSTKFLGYATASTPTGTYTVVVDGSSNTLGLAEAEGPSFCPVGGILQLYFDHLSSGGGSALGLSFSTSSGGMGGTWAARTACVGNAIGGGTFTIRHGTVFPASVFYAGLEVNQSVKTASFF